MCADIAVVIEQRFLYQFETGNLRRQSEQHGDRDESQARPGDGRPSPPGNACPARQQERRPGKGWQQQHVRAVTQPACTLVPGRIERQGTQGEYRVVGDHAQQQQADDPLGCTGTQPQGQRQQDDMNECGAREDDWQHTTIIAEKGHFVRASAGPRG